MKKKTQLKWIAVAVSFLFAIIVCAILVTASPGYYQYVPYGKLNIWVLSLMMGFVFGFGVFYWPVVMHMRRKEDKEHGEAMVRSLQEKAAAADKARAEKLAWYRAKDDREEKLRLVSEEDFTQDGDDAKAIKLLKWHTPKFPVDEFKAYVRKVFFLIQKAWQEHDPAAVRAYIVPAAFASITKRLWQDQDSCFSHAHKSDDIYTIRIWSVNIEDDIAQIEVTLNLHLPEDHPRRSDPAFIPVIDEVYVCNLFFTHEVGIQAATDRCPSCGAALKKQPVCAYCGSAVPPSNIKDHTWLLTDYSYWY